MAQHRFGSRVDRLWLELRLLCQPGIGFGPIAPKLCAAVRKMIGGDAAALFWLSADGMPVGFYHEDSPPEVRDLFTNEFERLFVGENEINVFHLAHRTDGAGGHLLTPHKDYFRSNTFNLLIRPSGHHHSLDLRIDCEDGSKAVLLLFRTRTGAFCEDDLLRLLSLQPLLRVVQGSGNDVPTGDITRAGVMIVDRDNAEILALCQEAEAIIGESNLVGQGIRLADGINTVPQFIAQLCAQLNVFPEAETKVTVPGGVLSATVTQLRQTSPLIAADRPIGSLALVHLNQIAPRGIELLDKVMEQNLSPLRTQILMYAACGGSRERVAGSFGISKEATKKHIAAIYRQLGAGRWEDVPALLAQN